MKGRLVRKRVRIDTAGTGEIGGEADLAVGPPQLVRRNVVHTRPLLGAVFIDVVEKDVVLLHDDSAFNLNGLDLISGCGVAGCGVAGLRGYGVAGFLDGPLDSEPRNPVT